MNESFEGNKFQLSKEEAKRWLEYCNCIDRLKQNQDFKLFYDVYTRSELMRNAYMLTDVNVSMNKDKKQLEDNIIECIKACSHLRNYIVVDIERQREIATNTLQAYEEEEARSNGGA